MPLKKYELQILKYNIYHINVIAIQNAIFIVKISAESIKKKIIVNMLYVKVTRIYNIINNLLKYNWYLDFMDNITIINLRLQNIKKY